MGSESLGLTVPLSTPVPCPGSVHSHTPHLSEMCGAFHILLPLGASGKELGWGQVPGIGERREIAGKKEQRETELEKAKLRRGVGGDACLL